ncbi:MAG: hypothetical protein O9282_12685 [Flavobacterium sp.]|jgi:hypothetical protein|uniref:hypothetical protein n=1 Tax=Flavobacterium macrobrachii TaxID=591204 RepID=UPI000DB2E174|nr:hypothetical protein [Flavobacterium sp.]PZO28532.1 MAG: hypothetical protein DCF13_08535 [Flavobacteriaceae bacterium]
MKFLVQFILVLFVAFLVTPTVVSIIEKKNDVSIFFSLAEEEIHKELKEVKADLKLYYCLNISKTVKKLKIISEKLSEHDKVSSIIFSPPPEFI